MLNASGLVTSSQSSAFVRNSKGPWPPEEGIWRDEERGEEILNHPNEVRYSITPWLTLTTCFLYILPVGTRSLDGAAGERWGVGWGHRYIPEYMTRCSRSDRSQPRLMKPKHFHRCFCTLGSTSSLPRNSTPTLFSSSNQPPRWSRELSPALVDA